MAIFALTAGISLYVPYKGATQGRDRRGVGTETRRLPGAENRRALVRGGQLNYWVPTEQRLAQFPAPRPRSSDCRVSPSIWWFAILALADTLKNIVAGE